MMVKDNETPEEKTGEKDKEKPEVKTETTPAEEAGDKEKTTATLDRADEIVSRRERVITREEALQKRKEDLEARKSVAGDAEGGTTGEEKSEDEKWVEGANERYEGTGMDPTPDDTPTEFK